jgi:hypothetical protein
MGVDTGEDAGEAEVSPANLHSKVDDEEGVLAASNLGDGSSRFNARGE